jgi:biopolymer transport protein ExbD
MNKPPLIVIILLASLFGCGHGRNGNERLARMNLVLLGNDSVVCYYGNSGNMVDLTRGKVSDSSFIETIMESAKDHSKAGSFSIAVKPAAGNDIVNNLRQVVDLLNRNDLQNRVLDTLDETEKKYFNSISLQEFVAESGEAVNHLTLPKDEKDQQALNEAATGNGLVILIFDEDGIYAYSGKNIEAGKKYTYDELKGFLAGKKGDGNFSVVIRPSSTSTYKNTVNMLDVMTREGIKKYKLIDISKEEERYINQIRGK